MVSHICHEVSQGLFHLPFSDSDYEEAGSPSSKYELLKYVENVVKIVVDVNVEDVSPIDGPDIEAGKEVQEPLASKDKLVGETLVFEAGSKKKVRVAKTERSARIEKLNSKLEVYKEDVQYLLGESMGLKLPLVIIKVKTKGKRRSIKFS